jgi:hypothetical protein
LLRRLFRKLARRLRIGFTDKSVAATATLGLILIAIAAPQFPGIRPQEPFSGRCCVDIEVATYPLETAKRNIKRGNPFPRLFPQATGRSAKPSGRQIRDRRA